MEKVLTISISVIMAILLCVGPAMAVPFPDNLANDIYDSSPDATPTARDKNDGEPDIFDAVNHLLGTTFDGNEDVDPYFVEPDYVWQELNGHIAIIGMTAGYSNTLGVYTGLASGDSKTQLIGPYSNKFEFLGDGTEIDPYPAALTTLGAGTEFGWYLYANQETYYYSDPDLNSDNLDHMMTFGLSGLVGKTVYTYTDSDNDGVLDEDEKGSVTAYTFSNPYLIAWEDLALESGALGDEDYDDMMYVVDYVAPVPEPTTLLLIGTGLVVLAVIGRRRFYVK